MNIRQQMETQTPSQLLSKSETYQWSLSIKYMEQEISFVTQILKAPIYRQNIPNLYEKLTDFLTKITSIASQLTSFSENVRLFEESLENFSEKNSLTLNEYCHENHTHFKEEFTKLSAEFSALKLDIFTFLSGALINK